MNGPVRRDERTAGNCRARLWQHEAPQAHGQQSQQQCHRGHFRERPCFHLNPPAASKSVGAASWGIPCMFVSRRLGCTVVASGGVWARSLDGDGQLAPTSSAAIPDCLVWSKLPDKSITYGTSLVKSIIGARPGLAKQALVPGLASAPRAAGAPAPPQVSLLTIEADWAGQRLDNFLMRLLKGVPKTHVYRIIRSGEVRINKARASADTRLEPGDQVRLPPVRTSARAEAKAQEISRYGAMSSTGSAAPARQFPVLFEDEHLLAIDKPAGVAVHGGSGVAFGVIEQLRMARPGEKFLELVHRLDRETSGVLLVAKKRMALKNLQEQFRERDTDKVYLALVAGHWPERLKVLDQPLQKMQLDGGERRVRIVDKDHPQAMRAVSLVKVRQTLTRPDLGELSLLEVTIRTGRTHQIRVHLAGAGHPIAGDDKYGDFELNRRLQKAPPATLARMFLHAWRLQFNHPAISKRIKLEAALPAELQTFLDHDRPQL